MKIAVTRARSESRVNQNSVSLCVSSAQGTSNNRRLHPGIHQCVLVSVGPVVMVGLAKVKFWFCTDLKGQVHVPARRRISPSAPHRARDVCLFKGLGGGVRRGRCGIKMDRLASPCCCALKPCSVGATVGARGGVSSSGARPFQCVVLLVKSVQAGLGWEGAASWKVAGGGA